MPFVATARMSSIGALSVADLRNRTLFPMDKFSWGSFNVVPSYGAPNSVLEVSPRELYETQGTHVTEVSSATMLDAARAAVPCPALPSHPRLSASL